MSGPVALHGGGEFEAGDEAVVEGLLRLAVRQANVRSDRGLHEPIRVAILPTAAAEWDPARSAAHGASAFERAAASLSLEIEVDAVLATDASSARDEANAAHIRGADLIHLPGGDPRRIMSTLSGTPVADGLIAAHRAGAVLAGASAGAMALGHWIWAPNGGLEGFGLVDGVLVIAHADERRWSEQLGHLAGAAPAGFGFLGIEERTAAITDDVATDPIGWRVVGEGSVRWAARSGDRVVVLAPGETFETAAGRS